MLTRRDAVGAPASRRVAQPRRGMSVESCLSAWPRSGSREFKSAARRGEQRRGVAQRATGERGAFFFAYISFGQAKESKCPAGA